MRVGAWYSRGLVPLDGLEHNGLLAVSLQEPDGGAADRVLLTGVSGVGKSTLLRGIGEAWAGLEPLLEGTMPQRPEGNVALVMEALLEKPLLICYAREESFWQAACERHPGALAVGVRGQAIEMAPELRSALLAQLQDAATRPNMLVLCDSEEVGCASHGVGALTASMGDVQQAVREAGGISQALTLLRARHPHKLEQLMVELNSLLYGKALRFEQDLFQVVTERGGYHAPEALSAGERRVLLLLLAVAMVLHPGGVLLVDEPESHVHPSQALGLLSTLEQLADRGGGQLILSSHTPQIWRRYENLGLLVALEQEEP